MTQERILLKKASDVLGDAKWMGTLTPTIYAVSCSELKKEIDEFLSTLPEEKEEKKSKHDLLEKVRHDELELLHDRQRFVIAHYCDAIGCSKCPLKEYDENDKETCESSILQNKIMDLEFNPLNH